MPEGVFPKPLCGLYCEDIWQIFILERASTRCFTRWKWKAYSEWTLVISGPHWRGAVFDQTLVKVKVKTSSPAFGDILCYFNMEAFSSSNETVAASSSTFIPYFSSFFFSSSRPSRATRNCCVLLSSVLKVCQLVHQGEDHLSLSSSLDSLGETEWKLSGSSCIEKSTNSFPSGNNQLFATWGHITMFFHTIRSRGVLVSMLWSPVVVNARLLFRERDL